MTKQLETILSICKVTPGLRCEDHNTYICRPEDVSEFVAYWKTNNFVPQQTVVTTKYPAQHLVIAQKGGPKRACEKMIGLSCSEDPESPINKSLRLWGSHTVENGKIIAGKLQHTAFDVDPAISMDFMYQHLTLCTVTRGERLVRPIKFMTPIFRYTDENDATLEQAFIATPVPYGQFIEIIRRGTGRDGQQFAGFNPDQVDNLYAAYDEYSKQLMK